MNIPTPDQQKKRLFYRCLSSKTIVKLRKILVTGVSIYYLINQLMGYLCPNYIDLIESYRTTGRVIEGKYVDTLEKYLMNNSEYYHLTQVFTYNKKKLEDRFILLLRFHYTHFVELENTKDWDAELIAEIKTNFTTKFLPSATHENFHNGLTNAAHYNDPYLIDKIILYQIQEMVAMKHDFHSSLFMEIGMTDLLRNYSAQALIIWYHWRGLILETDLVSLHNYANQRNHPVVLSTASICTDEKRTFHYWEVNKNAVRPHLRDRYNVLYRVPCFHLSSFSYLFRSEHIEYFIIGPRTALLPVLRSVVKEKNVHFILLILSKNETEEANVAKELLHKEYFSLFYSSHEDSLHFVYLLFFKFIERNRELQQYGLTLKPKK